MLRRACGPGTPRARSWSTPSGRGQIADLDRRAALRGRPDVLEQVTGFHVHRGAGGFTGGRCPRRQVLAAARRVVILEDINNHTNLGAIFRGARGARHGRGAAVADLRRPALPAQRAGEHGRGVRRPVGPLEPWPDGAGPGPGRRLHHPGDDPGRGRGADAGAPAGPAAAAGAAAGRGGPGLPRPPWRPATAGGIPMRRGVDSLNVAAATAVALLGADPRRPALAAAPERGTWLLAAPRLDARPVRATGSAASGPGWGR